MSAETIRLENCWRERAKLAELRPNSEAAQSEATEAWDEYIEACHEIDECLQPGCEVTVPDTSYCAEHRL